MSFSAICPACNTPLRVATASRGKRIKCPECGEPYTARPAARKNSSSQTGTFLVLGALAFVVLAAAVLLVVLLNRKGSDDLAAASPPAPVPTTPAPTGPVAPVPAPAPTPAPVQQPQPEKPLVVTTDQLRQQFGRDESAAERHYKDRTLEITGTVSAILHEAPLRGVCFGSLQDPLPPVLCDLAPDQAALAAKLKPGQKLTIRGVFMGKVQGGFVGLGKCQIVR